jgi:hypothetical protein
MSSVRVSALNRQLQKGVAALDSRAVVPSSAILEGTRQVEHGLLERLTAHRLLRDAELVRSGDLELLLRGLYIRLIQRDFRA